MKIRVMIRGFVIFCLFMVVSQTYSQTSAKPAFIFDPANIEFQVIMNGLTQPVFITNAGDGSGRLFIIEKGGRIRIFKNGSLLPAPFLDIDPIVNSTGSEQGLLALAFHPSYEVNGQFYTAHTDSNGSLVLSRFTRSSTDPDLGDPNSRITLLTISHPTFTNHNGGTLAFGPDGYLYWSTGDGGSGGDPSNNAQNPGSLLGKILRLNVDSGSPYSIPPSNPFFSNPDSSIRKEIWAYGLRNPWRFSFDRQTSDMYIGDVGQGTREEIDFQPSNDIGGRNYGWRVMEGSLCYNSSSGCDQSGKVLPVAEYDHSVGCSVTGGYVYRGLQYPPLQGNYFYGDFCTGVLFSLYKDPANGWNVMQVADTPYSISSFGEDENGEIYLADYGEGKIYRIQHKPDFTAPVVTSILRASSNPTSASNVYFTVKFSEFVTGVSASDFTLNTSGSISGVTIRNVTGFGNTYTVMVNTGTGGGTLRLDVPAGASISDPSGNPLGNAPFTGGEVYNVNSGERYDMAFNRMGDFDGDGKAEIAVFRPSDGNWHIAGVGNFVYGKNGDIPVVADYDGNGKDEVAVFRPSDGNWYIASGGHFVYGQNGDIPVPGDYNGDGKAEVAVFRPSDGNWYIASGGHFVYGQNGDIPVPADYNGDGKTDIAIFRPSNGNWFIPVLGTFVYGQNGDIPVPADYNGDGKTDIGVWRPSNGNWFIPVLGTFVYGQNGDIPVPADYNGDGKADVAVFRPSDGNWYIAGGGHFIYGAAGDIPT